MVYITASFKFFPDRRSLLKAFAWLQGYAAMIFIANLLIGSNYFYIMRKPPTASLLDVLGPWPWYLLVCEALAFVLFLLVYAPVWFLRRRSRV